MKETAALLSSTAIKQRLTGITGLLEQLRRPDAALESSAELIPFALPCLRDHNSKIALGALEILELLVSSAPESTLGLYLKPLWTSLVERLGDSKLQTREKAVDVIVRLSVVVDVTMVLDKLKGCMSHKNWRTREQSLHAIWRCLEQHNLFKEKQEELLDDVLELLKDSSKDVRDAAITALEKFYTFVGPSFLRELEHKNIRPAHMKTLTDRFKQIPGAHAVSARDADSLQACNDVPDSCNILPDQLSSILSSYDLPVSSSSSSMARYLESVRSRTQNEANAASALAESEQCPSQNSSIGSPTAQDYVESSFGIDGNDVSEKELQKQLNVVFDKLELKNKWDQRVAGLKMLQKLASQCSMAQNSGFALAVLAQGLRSLRERLCQQVSDLRSSVSKEACETIQTLADTLRDEFNAHAEFCLGNLLKATYVTIQVVSTSADTTIKRMIESTSNGYTRVIPKLIECVKSRNQVLRCNAVCYLTLILQKWSVSFLSKHSDLFVPIMPAILQDALGDVRAQSRKCYWAFHHLFPDEGKRIFASLDRSTQKNLNDDPSKVTANFTRQSDHSSIDTSVPQNLEIDRFALRKANALQPTVSASIAKDVIKVRTEDSRTINAEEATAEKLPRRVLGGSLSSVGIDSGAEFPRILSQGPMRVGLVGQAKSFGVKDSANIANETARNVAIGPLRVWSAPKSSQSIDAATESLYTSRQEPSNAGFHTSSLSQAFKAQRVQLASESHMPAQAEINEGENGPKRLPLASVPSPTPSKASSPRSNSSTSELKKSAKRIAPANGSERPKIAPIRVTDMLENALRKIESKSWSTRLEAAVYIGTYLQQQVDGIEKGENRDYKLDDHISLAFIKHLSDAHYRVSQGVLKNMLPLLKIANHNQRLLHQLKLVLPKLFQKFVDTKESVRVVARENLEYVALTVDNSTLAAIIISMLGDGSNMKVRAAMCHYLRELLPGAKEYMKHGTNGSHMRTFLLKIALLKEADVPVSVSSACGELVSVAAQLYGPEMNESLGLLPPSKRLIVSKVLKTKKIVLRPANVQKPPFSASTALHSEGSHDKDNDNQDMEIKEFKPERSRKRVESPSATSSGSACHMSQKRIYTLSKSSASLGIEDQKMDDQPRNSAPTNRINEVEVKATSSKCNLLSSALPAMMVTGKDSEQLEKLLHALEQNNLSETEKKHALYKTLQCIKTEVPKTWDRCFGRLLLVLVDAATENNVYALKVLQRLVEAQPSRAQMFFELLLQRLLDAMVNQVDVARHLMERILHDLVKSAHDYELTLSTLIHLDSDREPPTVQVVLRLIKVSLQACERNLFEKSAFLCNSDGANRLMRVLKRRLGHASSSVRKSAVDCLVAFHFATNENNSIVPKYLATELDGTQRRLVEIFIDRAKMKRHHIGLC